MLDDEFYGFRGVGIRPQELVQKDNKNGVNIESVLTCALSSYTTKNSINPARSYSHFSRKKHTRSTIMQ